jgi:hypothetical protein
MFGDDITPGRRGDGLDLLTGAFVMPGEKG